MIYPEPMLILSDGSRVVHLEKGERPIEATSIDIEGRSFTGILIHYKELKYSDFDIPEKAEYWVAVESLDSLPKKQKGILSSYRIGFGQIEITKMKKVEKRLKRERERTIVVIFFWPYEVKETVESPTLRVLERQLSSCRSEKKKLEERVSRLEVELNKWRNEAINFKEKYDAAASLILEMESQLRQQLEKAKGLVKALEIKYQIADAMIKSLGDVLEKKGLFSKLKGEEADVKKLKQEVEKIAKQAGVE